MSEKDENALLLVGAIARSWVRRYPGQSLDVVGVMRRGETVGKVFGIVSPRRRACAAPFDFSCCRSERASSRCVLLRRSLTMKRYTIRYMLFFNKDDC